VEQVKGFSRSPQNAIKALDELAWVVAVCGYTIGNTAGTLPYHLQDKCLAINQGFSVVYA
jgi:hypothetical protein